MTAGGTSTPRLAAAGAAAALMLALASCGGAPDPAPPPLAQPASPPAPPPPPPSDRSQAEIRQARAEAARAANRAAARRDASPASDNMAVFLRGAETDLIRRGRLRTDRDPADAGFSAETLARDFIQIALRDEYSTEGATLVRDTHPAPLRRWTRPVRLQPVFGKGIDTATQARDRAAIATYAARLQQVTGHPVGLAEGGGNFVVLVLNEDERRAIGPRLARLLPGIPARDIAAIRDLSPQNYCTVFAYSNSGTPEYARAVALIRDELPPRLRASCIHEELAQGMGLANDSPAARPSIFNDDEEFALLTRHDELLLQMLYDSRLRPGMTEAEAAPVVRQIAAELVGGS